MQNICGTNFGIEFDWQVNLHVGGVEMGLNVMIGHPEGTCKRIKDGT